MLILKKEEATDMKLTPSTINKQSAQKHLKNRTLVRTPYRVMC